MKSDRLESKETSVLSQQDIFSVFMGYLQKNDQKAIESILKLDVYDINFQDKKTGRTLLHEAIFHKMDVIVPLLLKKGADKKIRDKAGYNSIELAMCLHPLPKNIEQSLIERKQSYQYFRYMAQRANDRLVGSKFSVVIASTMLEVDKYIEDHPSDNKIGFVVEKPICLRVTSTELHMSPIYFERVNKKEIFVQFDSALSQFFILPKNASATRVLYFSPHRRQVAENGCYEDAIAILMTLGQSKGIVDFCQKNAINITKVISKQLSEEEIKKHNDFVEKKDVENATPLAHRLDYDHQSSLLQIERKEPLEEIHQLTKLPSILTPFIERYETMRSICLSQPESLLKTTLSGSSYLEIILKVGKKRNSEVKDAEIKSNLNSSDKKYDFVGHDFLMRRKRFHVAQSITCATHQRLFFKKIHEQMGLVSINETNNIVNNITDFSTGKILTK